MTVDHCGMGKKLARAARASAWLVALGLSTACSSQTVAEDAVTSHQEALVAQDIVLPLPNGAALTDVAVSANGSLKVADRVNLQQPAVIAGQLTNTGTAGTNIGASAIVGSVTSQGRWPCGIGRRSMAS